MPNFVTVTNTTESERRAIFTDEGYVTVEPGASRVLSVTDADQKANKAYFSFKPATQHDADRQEAAAAQGEADRLNPPQEIERGEATDEYAAMSDDMLRDEIEDKTGKRPHHNTARPKLIEQHKAL